MHSELSVASYLLLDQDGWPRYVGKTVDPKRRSYQHRKRHSWLSAFLILEWASELSFPEREKYWIRYFRELGFPLENKNNGGGGLCRHTPEQIEHLRRINLGRQITWASKISEGLTGKKRSEESKQKQARALKGRELSSDHKKKIGDAGKGREVAQETRDKIGAANRVSLAGRKLSSAHVAASAAGHRGISPSQATRDKIAESLRRRNARA